MRLLDYLYESKRIENFDKLVSSNAELRAAVKILKKIEDNGYKAYIVGGAVRDLYLNNVPGDIDIATNMPIEKIEKIYKIKEIGSSKDFGIVIVNQDGFSFEIANFRKESGYTGRKPSEVKSVEDIEDDLSRRDLTINALAMDRHGKIFDPHGGIKDIEKGVIRAVGDPKERFGEDYLRMMRTARFSARFGFDVDKHTKKAIRKLSVNVKNLSAERIRDEILKAAKDGKVFAKYLKILDDVGILKHILPEIQTLKWMKHAPSHHPEGPTVMDHILAALETSEIKDPIVNLSIALHDIGKSVTYGQKAGIPTYYGHDEAGIKLADSLAKRLKLSNKERDAIIFAVANHMKFHKLLEMKPSKIVKLVNSDHWDLLVAVAKADEFSRGTMFKHKGEFEKAINKAIEIKNMWGKSDRVIKLVDGHRVMNVTGMKPGPKVGQIIKKVESWIIDNNITDDQLIDNKIKELFDETKHIFTRS